MPGPGGGGRRANFLSEEEKQNAPKVTKELLQRILSYLRPYWKQLALVLACIIVSSVCSLFFEIAELFNSGEKDTNSDRIRL